MALLSGTLQPDEGDIGERKANRIAKAVGSENPEGNVRDKSPAINRAWLPVRWSTATPAAA
jgi:hypothetical protein